MSQWLTSRAYDVGTSSKFGSFVHLGLNCARSENFPTNVIVCFVLLMYFCSIFAEIYFVHAIFTVSVVGLYYR